LALVGCGSDDSEDPKGGTGGAGGTGGGTGGSGGSAGALPVPAPGEFLTVEPGEPTICSRGTPFRFFVAGGDPKKLVVDFRGGGACWNAVTCSIADAIFSPEAPTEAAAKAFIEAGAAGIYKLEDAANPVAGHTLVHIPYCTGDVHWGDATVDYSPSLKIHHKGFVNVTVVLDWIFARYEPEEILITGCSAGAYGAIGHSPRIADRYPNATIRVLADSGCGIVSDEFFQESFPNWNAQIPQIPGLIGKDILTLTIVDLYSAIAAHYPNARFAQQTSAFDKDQTSYFTAMGGAEADWSPQMMASLTAISTNAPDNFRYYMSPGPLHCLHPYDSMYTRASESVEYTQWLTDLMHAPSAPASVTCTATSCKQDPVCEACLGGTLTAPECSWCDGWVVP
jgi:hypothetical protein